jgi:hypothetical protein
MFDFELKLNKRCLNFGVQMSHGNMMYVDFETTGLGTLDYEAFEKKVEVYMNKDKTILVARAVRNWPGGIGELKLVWKPFYSKLSVEYRQIAVKGHYEEVVPDEWVKDWLRIFIRHQDHLQKDSYYLVKWPSPRWREFIDESLAAC